MTPYLVSRLAVCLLVPAAAALAETYLVTNTHDGGQGSFRWALSQADNDGLPDTVGFAIPLDDPGYDPAIGVWTIATDSLNQVATHGIMYGNVCIDGFSQALFAGFDANPYGPEIELAGPYPTDYGGSGFVVSADSVTIRGLCINLFHGTGIEIYDWPPGETTEGIVVEGCYVNVDPTGVRKIEDAFHGIRVSESRGVRIGGDGPEQRNIISGAKFWEVYIAKSEDVSIINNIIGADRTGTVDLGRHFFKALTVDRARGPHEIRDNLVAGRERAYLVNISLTESDSARFELVGNRIGVGLDGSDLGADDTCVFIDKHPRGLVANNTIAYAQGWFCVLISGTESDYITISRNSIYHSNRLALNLSQAWTENGACVDFVDGQYGEGVNEEIDPCLCDSVVVSTHAYPPVMEAYFTCMAGCVVEVFEGDPWGWYPCSVAGQGDVRAGMTYLGNAEEVSVGPVFSSYRFSMAPALPDGALLTATATNANGSTSEFGCACRVGEVGTMEPGCLPTEYAIGEPGPNPFAENVVLTYQLPEPGPVELSVFDLAGSEIATLVGGFQERGVYGVRWNGKDRAGSPVASGSYVLRFVSSGLVASKTVVMMR